MVSFKQWFNDNNMVLVQEIDFDNYLVSIWATESESHMFTEAQHRGQPIGGKYSVLKHRPHTRQGQEHIHVFAKNNQIFAINKDGTAHDQSHGTQIPKKVADAIRVNFPNFNLPENNFIESINSDTIQIDLIAENME